MNKQDFLRRCNINNLELKKKSALEIVETLRPYIPYPHAQSLTKLVEDYITPLFSDLLSAAEVLEGKKPLEQDDGLVEIGNMKTGVVLRVTEEEAKKLLNPKQNIYFYKVGAPDGREDRTPKQGGEKQYV